MMPPAGGMSRSHHETTLKPKGNMNDLVSEIKRGMETVAGIQSRLFSFLLLENFGARRSHTEFVL